MKGEGLDFNYLLLEHYKKLNLSENSLATLLMIDHLISDGNQFITTDLLSLKMSLPVKEIDLIFADLLTRGFIEYTVINGSTITTLNPLKEKLVREIQFQLNADQPDIKDEFNQVIEVFNNTLGRELSSVEKNKIKEWLLAGYPSTTIVNALKESVSKGEKSIRNIDQLLLKWRARDDIESEGTTSINENWQKNLEETIRIAKTPWLNVDDEDK